MFLPNLPVHLQFLRRYCFGGTRSGPKEEGKTQLFRWSKEFLIKAPMLMHLDPSEPLAPTVDASPYGVGIILSHLDKDGAERPTAFASCWVHLAGQRYSQFEKGSLAILFSVERFHQHLWGRKFEAVRGYKPLLGLLRADKPIPGQASPRVVRWALTLAASKYHLSYRPGKHFGHTDALIRPPLLEVPASMTEPADVLMLEHVYPGVLSRSTGVQATRRDPVLSQAIKAVFRGKDRPWVQDYSPHSHKSVEFSL